MDREEASIESGFQSSALQPVLCCRIEAVLICRHYLYIFAITLFAGLDLEKSQPCRPCMWLNARVTSHVTMQEG